MSTESTLPSLDHVVLQDLVDRIAEDRKVWFPTCGKDKMGEDVSHHGELYTNDYKKPSGRLDQICVVEPEESCSIALVSYEEMPEKENYGDFCLMM